MVTSPAKGDRIYSVQVGAFGKLEGAERLKKKLIISGYTAYVIMSEDSTASLPHKVRVGKVSTRAEADAISKRLKETHKLKGFVVKSN